MKIKFLETIKKVISITLCYPMVLLTALIAAISAVYAIHLDHEENQFLYTKMSFVACLGISLFFGIHILSKKIGRIFILNGLGTLFLLWFYYYLPNSEQYFTVVNGYILAALFVLFHLFVSFSGFLQPKRELEFWQFNKQMFINFFLTMVFSGVLIVGTEIAIYAISELFDFNFKYTIYPKNLFFVGILGSVFIFLNFNYKEFGKLEKDEKYPAILQIFTQYILIPILLLYLLILYLYAIKILLKWELPRGWVSYLILIYSIIGILALLLVYPLKNISTKSWVKIFTKIFYYTLLPLLVLLFIAIITRILEYGFTEPRYFVLILSIWLCATVFYFILLPKASIKFIPFSLFLFGVFSLVFPYFNAFSVAERSQKKNLLLSLTKHDLLHNGKIDFTKKISLQEVNDVAGKFEFLHIRKQDAFLYSLISEQDMANFKEILVQKNKYISYTLQNYFKNITSKDTNQDLYFTIKTNNIHYSVEEKQELFFIDSYGNSEFTSSGDHFKIVSYNDYFKLVFNKQTIDLSPEIKKIIAKHSKKKETTLVDHIVFQKKIKDYSLIFLIKQIDYLKHKNEIKNISVKIEVIILIKKNN